MKYLMMTIIGLVLISCGNYHSYRSGKIRKVRVERSSNNEDEGSKMQSTYSVKDGRAIEKEIEHDESIAVKSLDQIADLEMEVLIEEEEHIVRQTVFKDEGNKVGRNSRSSKIIKTSKIRRRSFDKGNFWFYVITSLIIVTFALGFIFLPELTLAVFWGDWHYTGYCCRCTYLLWAFLVI